MILSDAVCQGFSDLVLIAKKIFDGKVNICVHVRMRAHFFCLQADIFLLQTSLICLYDKQTWSCQPENCQFYQFRLKDYLSKL